MDLGDRRLRRGLIWLIGWSTIGCGPGDRLRSDLQLDVVGADLIDTDWVRICIESTLIHETPVGDGRLAIPGMPPSGSFAVSIHATEEQGSTGKTESVVLSENMPWARTEWSACSPTCTPCTIEKTMDDISDKNARLLSIHFMD